MSTTRRAILAASLAAPFIGQRGMADIAPIPVGSLTPQTGAGGLYGPSMVKVIRAVFDEVNAAGGVGGRKFDLTSEDDETNPDAGVRAARKLIDVNKAVAVLGTWASAVTSAVAPLCWDSRTMLFTVSGADSITKLPHSGYIIRTQPNSRLQSTRAGQFLLQQGSKRVFGLSAQTPFAVDSYSALVETLKQGGADGAGDVIYDASKSSFRAEVDQAMRAKPDTVFLNSYTPDLTVLLRELYRVGFEGKKLTLGYAASSKLLEALPPEVTEGLMSYAPSPDLDSPAYARVKQILGAEPDPYSCQVYDHASLVALSTAKAGAASGQAIHDAVRLVSQGAGQPVTSATDGLKLLAAGKEVNYDGASGPCDFLASGDIAGCKFRFDIAEHGRNRLLSLL